MRPRIINVGERHERLVVTVQRNVGDARVQCLCDCGNPHSVRLQDWGRTHSCGCLVVEATVAANTRHGYFGTPTYASWRDMLQRCRNPKNKRYLEYGERGIRVCARWERFENFLADMGERPENRTLDRIDNDGNYEPGNCRWATLVEQRNNRRPQRRKTHCTRGHEFTPENTRVRSNGSWECLTCAVGHVAASRERNRDKRRAADAAYRATHRAELRAKEKARRASRKADLPRLGLGSGAES